VFRRHTRLLWILRLLYGGRLVGELVESRLWRLGAHLIGRILSVEFLTADWRRGPGGGFVL
jgi:hypothetical protein